MTTTDVTSAKPAWGLRIFVIVVAAIELLSGLSDFPALFEMDKPSPGFEFAQQTGNAYIVLHPLLAFGALVPAALGRVRQAIAVLAMLVLANWLSDLPGAFIHELELGPGLFGLLPSMKYFGYPVIGGLALWLAWRNIRPWIAALLTAVPLAAQIIGVAGFAIGVMLYGF